MTHNSPVQHSQVLEVVIMLKLKYLQRNAKTLLNRVSYLEMGFPWFSDEFCPSRKCVICGEILSNEAINK
jgi:hypothetical protein